MSKHRNDRLFFLTTKAEKSIYDAEYPDNCYLVFGKETKGLPESLIYTNYDKAVRIPMIGALRSLNLANSVAIALYEALRQHSFYNLDSHIKSQT